MAPSCASSHSLLLLFLGILCLSPFLLEGVEGGEYRPSKIRKTNINVNLPNPPRIRDYVRVKNQWYRKKGSKKQKLRTEVWTPNHKLTLNLQNPPNALHTAAEVWPSLGGLAWTSIVGLLNYVHLLAWLLYSAVIVLIRMVFALIRLLMGILGLGPLVLIELLLHKAHPFHFNDYYRQDVDFYPNEIFSE